MLVGLFGVGGGIVYVPVLALGLGAVALRRRGDFAPLRSCPPSRQASSASSGTATRRRAGLIVGFAGMAGVEIGVLIAEAISEDLLRRLFGCLMVVVAAARGRVADAADAP